MNAEQRRIVREARNEYQRARLARAHATETKAARAARYKAEKEERAAVAEHVPAMTEGELADVRAEALGACHSTTRRWRRRGL